MKKYTKIWLNFLWIYLLYLIYTLIYGATDLISFSYVSGKFLMPLYMVLIGYFGLVGVIKLYSAVELKKIFLIICNGIYGVILLIMLSILIFSKHPDEVGILQGFILFTGVLILLPFILKFIFKRQFSQIQLYVIAYIIIFYINALINDQMMVYHHDINYYIIIFSISFPVLFYLFSLIKYSEEFINQINQFIQYKQFVQLVITFIFVLLFIYGIYTLSRATDNVYERVFNHQNVIDTDKLKGLILEERLKGAISAGIGGLGLLIKFIFSTQYFYKSLDKN